MENSKKQNFFERNEPPTVPDYNHHNIREIDKIDGVQDITGDKDGIFNKIMDSTTLPKEKLFNKLIECDIKNSDISTFPLEKKYYLELTASQRKQILEIIEQKSAEELSEEIIIIRNLLFNSLHSDALNDFFEEYVVGNISQPPLLTSAGKPKYRPRKDDPLQHLKKYYKLQCFGYDFDEINQAELRREDSSLLKAIRNYVLRENKKRRNQGVGELEMSRVIPTSYATKVSKPFLHERAKKQRSKEDSAKPLTDILAENVLSPKEHLRELSLNYPNDRLLAESSLAYIVRLYPVESIEKYGDIRMKDISGAGYPKLYTALKSYFYNKGLRLKGRTLRDLVPEAWVS